MWSTAAASPRRLRAAMLQGFSSTLKSRRSLASRCCSASWSGALDPLSGHRPEGRPVRTRGAPAAPLRGGECAGRRAEGRSVSMLSVRVITCVDVQDGSVVKGLQFVRVRDSGDPVEQPRAYAAAGADELMFLDSTASDENRG